MRSVYVQSKSLVRSGFDERERMAWYVSGRFGRYGHSSMGTTLVRASHVRQEHNIH